MYLQFYPFIVLFYFALLFIMHTLFVLILPIDIKNVQIKIKNVKNVKKT